MKANNVYKIERIYNIFHSTKNMKQVEHIIWNEGFREGARQENHIFLLHKNLNELMLLLVHTELQCFGSTHRLTSQISGLYKMKTR
jgi:hypothetical protein